MRAPSTLRARALLGAAAALLGVTAACSDSAVSTAPGASAAPAFRRAPVTRGAGRGDTVVVRFVVEPLRQTAATFGEHKVVFSGQSICDPASSGDGPGTRELSCAPITRPVTVIAKSWTDRSGRPHVDFQPALRFTPDDRKPVTLYLTDREASADALATIVYCDERRACIDATVADPELATRHVGTGGMLARRLTHFSGYHIILGRDDSLDGGY